MNLSIFQADAFAEELFRGNPAAVIPLSEWLPDHLMQKIALENNLSETAFFIPGDGCFHLRWFTPTTEVNLCGHGTLATAHILFNHLGYQEDTIQFQTRGGQLSVTRQSGLLYLNFPVSSLKSVPTPQGLTVGLGLRPLEVMQGRGYLLAVYKNEQEIRQINPDFALLVKLPYQGIIVTATGGDADFVSRFFAPAMGIHEDPVTGSAHTLLIPYWAPRMGKSTLLAHQISKRGGVLHCELLDDRVKIGGKAVTFMEGKLFLQTL
jgi:PhzF family phenazine biosynthesis protein